MTQRARMLLLDVVDGVSVERGAKAARVTSVRHLLMRMSVSQVAQQLGGSIMLSLANATLELGQLPHVLEVQVLNELEGLCEAQLAQTARGRHGVKGRYVRGEVARVAVATTGLEVRADVRGELDIVGEYEVTHVALCRVRSDAEIGGKQGHGLGRGGRGATMTTSAVVVVATATNAN